MFFTNTKKTKKVCQDVIWLSASLGLLVSPRKERHIYILVISPTTKYLEIKIFYAKLFLFQYKMKQINKAIAFEYVICKREEKEAIY